MKKGTVDTSMWRFLLPNLASLSCLLSCRAKCATADISDLTTFSLQGILEGKDLM